MTPMPTNVARQPTRSADQASGAVAQQGAQGADPHVQAGHAGKPHGRKPARIERKRGHQIARGAEPHEQAAEHQPPSAACGRKHDASGNRDQHARQETGFGPEAIERDAERDLGQAEHQKISAGQKTDLGGGELNFPGKIRRDHAHGIAQELAHRIERAQCRHARGGQQGEAQGLGRESTVGHQVPSPPPRGHV